MGQQGAAGDPVVDRGSAWRIKLDKYFLRRGGMPTSTDYANRVAFPDFREFMDEWTCRSRCTFSSTRTALAVDAPFGSQALDSSFFHHVAIGHRCGGHGLLQQAMEQQRARGRAAAAEAKDELVQVGIQVLGLH